MFYKTIAVGKTLFLDLSINGILITCELIFNAVYI